MLRKNLNDLKNIVQGCNLEVISDKFLGTDCSNIYVFKCLKCNNVFNRTWSNLLNNKKCPECKKKDFIQYNTLTKNNVIDFLKTKNLSIISNYESARKPIDLSCNIYNCSFSNAFCNIKAGSGCPKCSNGSSTTEEKVREIFERLTNKQFPTVRPNFLKNPETKMNLELDGYCEELKLAFEYDGEYHYIEYQHRKGLLIKQQHRDAIKDTLCKNAGVELIRINYLDKPNLEEIIKNKIKEKINE